MIAVIVAESTAAGVRAAFARLESLPADSLIELRLDTMDVPDPELVRESPRRVIATCRRPSERGLYRGFEADRENLLRRALAAGAAFIDVEHEVRPGWTWLPADHTLVSVHDFEGRGTEACRAAIKHLDGGAAYAKLALKAHNLADLIHLRILAQDAPGRLIVLGLGIAGTVTRALSHQTKAPWTYVRAQSDQAAPEGLAHIPTVDDFSTWGLLSEPPKYALGVLSDRAGDSIGPWMFNRLFQQHGIPATYLPISTSDPLSLKPFLLAWGLHGLSVTIPFKRAALSAADQVTPLAKRVGAANTLYIDRGQWIADNTDVIALRDGLLWGGREALAGGALVVGAGGAARAAIVALEQLGCPTSVTSRKPEQAQTLAKEFGIEAVPMPSVPPRILVNATPIGSTRDPDSLPVPADLLTSEQFVYDVTYGPRPSPLIRLARERGARVLTGVEMYALQAKEQLDRWFPDLSLGTRELLAATQFAIVKKFVRDSA